MNARPLVALTALALTLAGATAARADQDSLPAWQEPGYVMEVVIAKAKRPGAAPTSEPIAATTLAWQEPGYVEEIVVVKASRSEALRRAAGRREALRALLERSELFGLPTR